MIYEVCEVTIYSRGYSTYPTLFISSHLFDPLRFFLLALFSASTAQRSVSSPFFSTCKSTILRSPCLLPTILFYSSDLGEFLAQSTLHFSAAARYYHIIDIFIQVTIYTVDDQVAATLHMLNPLNILRAFKLVGTKDKLIHISFVLISLEVASSRTIFHFPFTINSCNAINTYRRPLALYLSRMTSRSYHPLTSSTLCSRALSSISSTKPPAPLNTSAAPDPLPMIVQRAIPPWRYYIWRPSPYSSSSPTRSKTPPLSTNPMNISPLRLIILGRPPYSPIYIPPNSIA